MKMRGSSSKNVSLSVRVTPRLREIVVQVAHSEGLDVSEWLRNVIIEELKKRGALPTTLTVPLIMGVK
jgi:predicted HicB family RNase H-like nuclease